MILLLTKLFSLAPGYPHQVQWNHADPAASDNWANGCMAMVDSGFVDGCFMDGCTKDECGSGNPGMLLKCVVNFQTFLYVDIFLISSKIS